VLPKHTKDIHKASYNSAYSQYADAEGRDGKESQEEVAVRVFWDVVKQQHKKDDEYN